MRIHIKEHMHFGTAEISKIEYLSFKNGERKTVAIKDLQLLSIVSNTPSDPFNQDFNKGHCLAIIFGENQRQDFEEISYVFCKNYFEDNVARNDFLPFEIFLLGKDGIKIPTLCAGGNGYSKYNGNTEETACLHVYVSPCIFDNKMTDSQSTEQLIKEHILWAQDKGACDQCVRPWHDGLCNCKYGNDNRMQNIAYVANKLIRNGNDLKHL